MARFERFAVHSECGSDYKSLILCHDDELLIGVSTSQIDFFDVAEEQLKMPPMQEFETEEGQEDVMRETPAAYFAENDWLLVLTCNELKIYNATTAELVKSDVVGDYNPERHHQAKEFFSLQGSLVGLLRGSGKKLVVLDINDWKESGAVIAEVEPPDPSTMITRCAIFSDGQVACLFFKADCYEPGNNPAKMNVYSREGSLQNDSPYDLMDVPFAVGYEFFLPKGDEEVLFSVFEADSSAFYSINKHTGEYKKIFKYTGMAQLLEFIEGNTICTMSGSMMTIVDVIDLPEHEPTEDSGQREQKEDEEEETNSANQITNTFKDEVDAVTILPSTSRYAALGGRNFQMYVWDLAELKSVRLLDCHDYGVYTSHDMMKYPTSSTAVTVNAKNKLIGFDLKTLEDYGPHEPAFGGRPVIKNFAVVDSRTVIGTTPEQNVLKMIEFKTGKVCGSLKCKAGEKISGIQVGANGRIALCTKIKGKTILVWDLKKKSRLPNLTFDKANFDVATMKIDVTGNGKLVVGLVDEMNSNVIAWDTATGKGQQPRKPEEVEGNAGSFAISRKLAGIVVGYQDGSIAIYDLKTLELSRLFNIFGKSIDTMYVAEDGGLLGLRTFMENNTVTVIDPIKEERLGSITVDSQIWTCQFTRNNNFMMLGGANIKGVIQFYIHRPSRNGDGKGEKPSSRAGKEEKKGRKKSAKSGKGSNDNASPFEKVTAGLKKKEAFYGEFKSRKLTA